MTDKSTHDRNAESWTKVSATTDDSTAPLRVPPIEGYELMEPLGRGGMGVVYRAKDTRLGRTVALKMLSHSMAATPNLRVRFDRETRAIANLQHPNIAPLYESGESDGIPWFAMELLSGGSLEDRLHEGPWGPYRAAKELELLAKAMAYCHRHGVVHRDLKPSNVLISEDGIPKITDFGIAKHMEETDRATRTGDVLGTPSYMAPEQASGVVKRIDATCDVYALGAILYHCLTGVPPFRGPDPLLTVMRVLSDDPVPPRHLQTGIPRDIETICLKCLEKQPSRRYGSANDLAEDLARFSRQETILARPMGTAGRVWKWARRRPALAALWTVIVLATASLLGGGTWYSTRLRTELQRTRELSEAGQSLAEWLVFDHAERLNRLAGSTKSKEALAEQLLSYLQKMETASCDRDEDEFSRQIALAYQRIAEVMGDPHFNNLGRTKDALEIYEKSLRIWEQLAAEDPESLSYQIQGIETRRRIAWTRGDLGANEESIRAQQQLARQLRELQIQNPESIDVLQETMRVAMDRSAYELARGNPTEVLWQVKEGFQTIEQIRLIAADHRILREAPGSLYRLRGLALLQMNEKQAAADALQRALDAQRQLLQDDPFNTALQSLLSSVLIGYGDVIWELDRIDEASLAYKEAEQIRRQLAEGDPDSLALVGHLLVAVDRMGYVYGHRGDSVAVMAAYRECVDLSRRLLEVEPDNVEYKRKLINAAIGLAESEMMSDLLSQAAETMEEVLPIVGSLPALTPDYPPDAELTGDTHFLTGNIAAARARAVKSGLDEFASLMEKAEASWQRSMSAFAIAVTNSGRAAAVQEKMDEVRQQLAALPPAAAEANQD